jgi:benzylsuccinate CoA-transferase BbsF subunit
VDVSGISIAARRLADHGATVVHVESERRPDALRGGGPFKDGVKGWNRPQFFGDFNTSKLGLTLGLKNPHAKRVARKLIAWADVFIESFAPAEAVERMLEGRRNQTSSGRGAVRPRRLDSE